MGLRQASDAPLIGVVSRLTTQKGIDLLVQTAPALGAAGVQLAVLGSGDAPIESDLRALANSRPDAVAVRFGYDEALRAPDHRGRRPDSQCRRGSSPAD